MPGHKPNRSKVKYRERWNSRHPEGRKVYSIRRKLKKDPANKSLQKKLDNLIK